MASAAVNRRRAIERLYWRAGFGALPSDITRFLPRGLAAARWTLLHPSGPALRRAPAPTVDGFPIDPVNEWGHDVLWWLDRAVRGNHQLVERMTLNWHDHFAVSNDKVGDSKLMINHYFALRRNALGSFRALAQAMVKDRAMQLFLDLANSTKWDPNENFAREMFELYTLGVNNGYTEKDIREAARAFTGFTFDWNTKRFGWNATWHDTGVKRILGHTGRFGPADVINLAINHPRHAPYLCRKLWGYFTPLPCPTATLRRMVYAYRSSKTQIRPVVDIILNSPEVFASLAEPNQVKPPFVYVAGMLRKTGQTVTTPNWRWLLDGMGQTPFYPPNVSGWEQDTAWMSTATVQGRYESASHVVERMKKLKDGSIPKTETPTKALASAFNAVGRPWIGPQTRAMLIRTARLTPIQRTQPWQVSHYWPERQRILRHVLLAGPDAQVC